MKIQPALVATTLALATAVSFAGTTSTPNVDARQANQEQRIDQGVASGELTKHETRRLEKEQVAINRAEDKAKADGSVTKAERQRLHKMQNRASRDIHHQKHDVQARN